MSMSYLMTHTCDVEQSLSVSGSDMTTVQNWTKVIIGARCRVQPHQSKKIDDFSVPGKETYARIHFYPPIRTEENNRIVITGGPSRLGQIWEVIGDIDADNQGQFSCTFARLYGMGIVDSSDKNPSSNTSQSSPPFLIVTGQRPQG